MACLPPIESSVGYHGTCHGSGRFRFSTSTNWLLHVEMNVLKSIPSHPWCFCTCKAVSVYGGRRTAVFRSLGQASEMPYDSLQSAQRAKRAVDPQTTTSLTINS